MPKYISIICSTLLICHSSQGQPLRALSASLKHLNPAIRISADGLPILKKFNAANLSNVHNDLKEITKHLQPLRSYTGADKYYASLLEEDVKRPSQLKIYFHWDKSIFGTPHLLSSSDEFLCPEKEHLGIAQLYPNARSIKLGGNADDESLIFFQDYNNLQKLSLSLPNLEGYGLHFLPPENIKDVFLNVSKINDLTALSNMSNLETLDYLSDNDSYPEISFPNLHKTHLHSLHINSYPQRINVDILSKLPTTILSVSINADITELDLDPLSTLPHLDYLYLGKRTAERLGLTHISPDGVFTENTLEELKLHIEEQTEESPISPDYPTPEEATPLRAGSLTI